MTWPSIGVVIPTQDRPELLKRAVAAVLAQDYPGRVDVVVVYDRAEPAPSEVPVLTNTRSPGLAGARNTGILALDTELVAFCDDDDVWAPEKLRAQVLAGGDFTTCAIEVEFGSKVTPRLAGRDRVELADLTRSRMAMLHASTFLARRRCLLELGLVAEEAPGSQNEDWDLLLRAARRGPIVHVDHPLVKVQWGRGSRFAYDYPTKIASLRWMLERHPELRACRPGAARVYGQLACWSAAAGDRRAAWQWATRAVRHNWREPRTAIALAAATGAVRVETVLAALHRHGRGI